MFLMWQRTEVEGALVFKERVEQNLTKVSIVVVGRRRERKIGQNSAKRMKLMILKVTA